MGRRPRFQRGDLGHSNWRCIDLAVTLTEILLILVAFLMPLLPAPKRKPKKRHYLQTRTRLRRGAVYNRYKPPTAEQIAFAEKCRQQNLGFHSPAIEALEQALREIGIGFEREVVTWFDGNRFVIVDVLCRSIKIIIEADGAGHRHQKRYDIQRDAMLREVTGCQIIREYNGWFLSPNLKERLGERFLEIDRLRRLELS
jgi:very-short-patch-repair endonuclease